MIKREEKRVETTSEPVETMLNQKKQVFCGKKQTNVGKWVHKNAKNCTVSVI